MIEPGDARSGGGLDRASPEKHPSESKGSRARRPGSVALLGVVLVAFLGVGVWWVSGLGPRIKVPQGVPGDVSTILDMTWPRFLDAFPAQHECIGDVTLLLVFEVEGGAASYDPDETTIRIEIPTTPERFEESLVHELGHHLEHRCNPVDSIGDVFIAAQGLDPTTEWFDRDRWFEAPTEHFAEAVVQLTLGERRIHADRFAIDDASLRMVSDWARGPGGSSAP